ncbi:MAG: helix-turn-helix transcriptional regulator [Acidobacteriota bacterium]|nr:helix-turn-helix transcriptional regulator [Acidobacteriota bacterium]
MTAKAPRGPATAASGLEEIVGCLQQAALDERRWSALSARIEDAVGGFSNHLVVMARRGGSFEFLFSSCLVRGEPDPETERTYIEEYAFRDERVRRFEAWPNGRLLHNREVYTPTEQRTSAVYRDFLPRFGSNNQMNVRLNGLHGNHIVWVLSARPDRDWSSRQIGVVNHLLPHVHQFVNVRQTLAAANAQVESLAGLLDRTRLGVIHLDSRARVLEANEPARSLLRAGDRLIAKSDGQLGARWRSDDAKLGRLLAACCLDGVGASMTVRPTGESLDAGPVTLQACPVSPDLTSFDTRGVAAQLLLTEAGSGPVVDPRSLAEAYDLTAAESGVAVLLAEGRTVGEIAESTGRKESTVRWHVRNLHSKLGVHRQSDLVRLVLSMAAGERPR